MQIHHATKSIAMDVGHIARFVLIACIMTGCQAKPSKTLVNQVARGPGADDLAIWPDQFHRARVFIFVRTDCPIANRYAPEIKQLHDQFRNVAEFVLVYCSPRESMAQIETHVIDYFENQIPVLRDAKRVLVGFTGASVTPEAIVYSKDKLMLYRGRIDDRYVDFGVTRAQPRRRDLHDVLIAIQNDTPVACHETEAVGCPISDLVMRVD